MKRLIALCVSAAALMAFNMVDKKYECTTVGISYNDGNQTRNIPVTPKTAPFLQKTLKDFYQITVIKKGKDVNVSVGKHSEILSFAGKWRGYDQYMNREKSVIFMPDKNATKNDAALIIPQQRLVIYYNCK